MLFESILSTILATVFIGQIMDELPVERVTPEEAVERLAACGLEGASYHYDDLIRSYVIELPEPEKATRSQLECAEIAVGYHDLELPGEQAQVLQEIRTARWAPYLQAKARTWLNDQGINQEIPKFDPEKHDDAEFARMIENICGPNAEGALQSDYGPHTISPDWIRSRDVQAMGSTPYCIMQVALLADFRLGFIGNEAIVEVDGGD